MPGVGRAGQNGQEEGKGAEQTLGERKERSFRKLTVGQRDEVRLQ